MKICMITNLYPPYILGGAEIVVAQLAEALKERGNEVLVITSSPDNQDSLDIREDIKVYQVHPWNLYTTFQHPEQNNLKKPIWHGMDIWNLKSYQSIKNILELEKPDIVNIHNFKGLSMAVFDAVKNFDLPLVFTAHDCSLICPRANLMKGNGEICLKPALSCNLYRRINLKLINQKVDWLTAPSDFIIEKLKSSGFFKSTRTTKIPLGMKVIETENIKTYDILDIAYMGSLNRIKGVHNLITAFKALDGDNIRLHIFGKGTDEDEFKTLSHDDNRIMFYGFVDPEKIMEKYANANITVLPSICYDNSPMMIYESLMSGTPVIGSKIGGIPELIEDGVNGYLFEPGNVNELIEILRDLQENPKKLIKLEEGAYQSAQKYDMENHLNALEDIYLTLCSEN